MAIVEKLKVLHLNDDELAKAKEKFLATLALVSDQDFQDTISYLEAQGVTITRAREIKVGANSKNEVAKKFDVLREVKATDIYVQDPSLLNRNVIDIYKRIKYCIQTGRDYKRADGTYEPFLFSEAAWQKEFNRESTMINEVSTARPLEESFVTVEPVVDGIALTETEPLNHNSIIDTDHIDIQEFMAQDTSELDAKTTNFAAIREELEEQLAALDALKAANVDETISFNDLEPESYGMGRAA